MSMWIPPDRSAYPGVIITPFHDVSVGLSDNFIQAPASSAVGVSSQAIFYPVRCAVPFVVSKAFVLNGATVGTDSWDLGVYRMTDMTTGRLDLVRSTGAVVSAGTINRLAEASAWKVAANSAAITAGNDSTDSATYTTASVTLKAGKLYIAAVENSAASAGTISSITNTGAPTFAAAPATSTTQYNGTANRISIWTCVPTVDYTGTLVITFGATQTGCVWAINEFSGVDTTTNNGIVQSAVGTGTSVTPLATLAAFGSANNATFQCHGHAAATATTAGTGFTELSDTTTATPAQALETEWTVANDTTADATITSAAWGAVAVEIKADASSFVIPASMPGAPNTYLAFTCNGSTATFFLTNPAVTNFRPAGVLTASNFPLPSNLIPSTPSGSQTKVLFGFSSRSLTA